MHQIDQYSFEKIKERINHPLQGTQIEMLYADGMHTSFKILMDGRVFYTPMEGHSVSGCFHVKECIEDTVDYKAKLVGENATSTLKIVDEYTDCHSKNYWVTEDEVRFISNAIRDQDTQYIQGESGWTFINMKKPVIEFNGTSFHFDSISPRKKEVVFYNKDCNFDYMIFATKPDGKVE